MSKSKLFRSVVALVTGLLLLFSTMTVGFAATTTNANPTKIYATNAAGNTLQFDFNELFNAYATGNTAYTDLWEGCTVVSVVVNGVNVDFKAFFDAFAAQTVSSLAQYAALADAKTVATPETAYVVDATGTVATTATVLVPLTIESAGTVGVKAVQVKFNKAVDTTKAVLKVKKGAAIYGSTVAWNADKDTATLTTLINLPANDYTVEVTGLTDTALTKAFTVAAPVASSIQIVSQTVDLTNSATISFKVLNQYGENMNVAGNTAGVVVQAYNTTQNRVEALTNLTADEKLTFSATFATAAAPAKVGDAIRVTVTYAGLTAQSTVTVIAPASGAQIAFGDVAPLANTTRISVNNAGLVVPYTLSDQYGASAKLPAHTANFDAVADVETIGNVQFISSNPAVLDVDTLAVDANGVLTVTAGATAGTATVTGIINASGSVATFTVSVNNNPVVDSLAITSPTALVAAGETVQLPATAADQFGGAIAAQNIAVGNMVSSNTGVVANAGITLSNGKLSVVTLTAGTTTISVYNVANTKVVGTVTVVVEAAAYASQVTSVSFSPKFEAAATKAITTADFVVVDQYGRVIPAASLTGFAVAKKDATVNTFGLAGTTFTAGATAGNQVFTVNASFGGTTTPNFEFTLGVVATTDIASYSITAVPTIYNDAPHAATLELVGKTAAGESVVLTAGKVTSSTTSNSAVATVAGLVVTGVTKGTSTIALWNNANKLAETTVTVSDVAPVATSVKFVDASMPTVVHGATVADFKPALELKDQYGKAITLGPTTGMFTSSSAKIVLTNGVVTTNTASAGDKVTIGYVTSNGLVVTTEITVQ